MEWLAGGISRDLRLGVSGSLLCGESLRYRDDWLIRWNSIE